MKGVWAVTASFAALAAAQNQFTATDPAGVHAAAATAITRSPTSHVRGKVFDRFVVVWLENTDYDKAVGDPNLAWLAKRGITLSNYNAVTHPSEPNYVSSIGGEYFGMDNDDFNRVPQNVSTVIDLLEDRGISWGEYQEDMPYTGFEGFAWVNQKTGANDYVRKHNPAVIYDSVTVSDRRLSYIKNLTMFYEDLEHDKLPQWMFITPNMTSDGHDTSVTVAGVWTRNFLQPLLNNKNFMKNTLVLVTFDENHTYTDRNTIAAILLGDVVPKHLEGTIDNSYYNHYSEIATVEANWNLHTLGRHDVGANVFKLVGDHTGDKIRQWTGKPTFSDMYFNSSYTGPFNDAQRQILWPVPNTDIVWNHRTVLPEIKRIWGRYSKDTIYTGALEIPDGVHPPKGYFTPPQAA